MSDDSKLTPVPEPRYPAKPPPEPGTVRYVVHATMDGAFAVGLLGAGVGLAVGVWRRLQRNRTRRRG